MTNGDDIWLAIRTALASALFLIAAIVGAGGCGKRDAAPHWDDAASPDLAIFRASRMNAVFEQVGGGEPTAGLAAFEAMRGASTKLVEGSVGSAAAAAALTAASREADAGPTASLQPAVPLERRLQLIMLPRFLGLLEPVWERSVWSAEDQELMRAVTAHLTQVYSAPAVEFVEGGAKENSAALQQVSVWFRDLVSEDSVIAAMIFTLDDGPYVGLPVPENTKYEVIAKRGLVEELVLELGDRGEGIDGPRWVFRARRGERTLWECFVSQAPSGDLTRVELPEFEPTPVGAYGWKLQFETDGPSGNEAGYLYVAANGALRFYYVSW